MEKLEPVKTSLIAHLVEFINLNLADVLNESTCACPVCKGSGTTGGERRPDGSVFDDGTLMTCAECNGVGATVRYQLDFDQLKKPRFGVFIEGFDVKQGQVVPKMRSKTSAFAMLVKLLGFDKAVIEVAGAATFTEALSEAARAEYVEQLKEMATMGLLD